MSKPFIVALDEGTTSARAAVYDLEQGKFVRVVNQSFGQIYPRPGWVEQDLNELYAAQVAALNDAVILAGIRPAEILSVGITNQRETVCLCDAETGEPACHAIGWQCRRSAPLCERLRADGLGPEIFQRTGLTLDAYFSASKLRWALDHEPKVQELLRKNRLRAGTVDSFLIWRLTEGRSFVTDPTNASRTMLYNLSEGRWDSRLLELFGVPANILPEVVPSDGFLGETSVLGQPVPLCGAAGDQQAALFGQGCLSPGTVKNTYGTGCFLLSNLGGEPSLSQDRLLTTVAYAAGGGVCYAREGSVFHAGSAVQWLRDGLGIIRSAAEIEAAARSVDSANGVYVVPAFTGLGAPYWDMEARGIITGLTRGTDRRHLCRAVLESIAYRSRDVLEEMKKDLPLSRLYADGGASANDFLMQFQADIAGIPVVRRSVTESTALGAVCLSALGMRVFSGLGAVSDLPREEKVFEPSMPGSTREALYAGWKEAVSRSLSGRA